MHLVIKRPKDWPTLKKGDSIQLISPASKSLINEISKTVKFIENWGIKPIIHKYKEKNTEPFLAHKDLLRFEELKEALYNKESSIIATIRGGYGSARLLTDLLKLEQSKEKKLLIGFSDITSLHLALNNCWKISSLHAPVIYQCAYNKVNEKSIKLLKDILMNNLSEISYSIYPLNKEALSIKSNTRFPILLGGNLSMIQTSISTPWSINKNQPYSMLIEEVNEKAYSVDRMLNHLKNTNIFENCRGIFIGDIIEKYDNNQKHMNYVIEKFSSSLNIPIFSIEDIGHGPNNIPIPLGVKSTII